MTLFKRNQWLWRPAAILIAVMASPVSAGATPDCATLLTLVSRDPTGPAPNERSFDVVMTPDARFVVFTSLADNITAGDANQGGDVFLLDRDTNQIRNVHINNAGHQGNKPAGLIGLAVTPDGDKIAFTSEASNLGTQFTGRHIYVRYRQAGLTILASANQADGANSYICGSPAISDNGRYVAYWAYAEGGGTSQVWVRDIWLGTTTRVSSAPNGDPGNAHSGPKTDSAGGIYPSGGQIAISADGRYIAYGSRAYNLIPGDTPNTLDIFIYDQQTHSNELVSVAPDGAFANQSCMGGAEPGPTPDNLAMTPDARYIAFTTKASNLIENDPSGFTSKLIVRDRLTQTNSKLALPFVGTLVGAPTITPDGRYVFFILSGANGIVPGYTTGDHRFRYDRQTDVIAIVPGETPHTQPFGWAYPTPGSVSADGQTVAFCWDAPLQTQIAESPRAQAFVRRIATESDDDCNLNLVPDACETDYADPAAFVDALIAESADSSVACLFDRNGDGRIDGLDVQPFIDDLLSN
ncbi:MAG TPA: hypothetical protein P5081_00830 [Phycisphaerae bacterium]|nr:hypothetical protein [Phycisphaerae bacterium]HRW51396.1 hypothetical protein [Phycisphaerae bacterium]